VFSLRALACAIHGDYYAVIPAAIELAAKPSFIPPNFPLQL